ncbi:hypothetical protein JMJ35_009069 [Cladonia borealis]|uniref:Uncharacterized protein n=1 Tax=Cladonia borealis TaxID=184061 RepID=A0AA39QW43_9LECA|nr:hypothetical protein JMJ35_009069 [Cladonia borealis]
MRSHYLPLLLPLLSTLTTALYPTKQIYQFPVGTWLENLVIRPCGSILITSLTSPSLYQINPFTTPAQEILIHNFTDATWTVGITQTTPDTFYVIVANGSLQTLSVAPGSNRLYRISFPPPSPHNPNPNVEVSLAATLSGARLLNGATTLTPNEILTADSVLGIIWLTDITTGSSHPAFSDPLMLPTAAPPGIGINGIKILPGIPSYLYFTNSALALLAKIPLHPNNTAAGPAEIVTHAPAGTSYDDFTFDIFGNIAFLATSQGNSIAEVKTRNGKQEIVAGNVNSTKIAEPTSAQLGGDGVLYVTTAGGLAVPVVVGGEEVRVGGQLVAVEVGLGV